jgi:phage terminase large subunit-like protein
VAFVSLWPERWPAIAKQECTDQVMAAPIEERAKVKFGLPCQECEVSTQCLNAKRKELGPLLYDREILTSPRTSESSLFPRTMIEPLLKREQSLVKFWQKPYGDEERWAVVQAWDLAWSEKIGGDWLVCMTGRLDRETGQRRLLDVSRWQRLTFDEQVAKIDEMWRMYQAEIVVIESDASQKIWTQHVGRNTSVPVVPHSAGGKKDFATGVPGLLILLENKKWEFPYARDGWNAENMDVFLSELEAFGWNDGKLQGVGEHDDTVMCWWHLNWGMERMALGQSRSFRRGVQPSSAYI